MIKIDGCTVTVDDVYVLEKNISEGHDYGTLTIVNNRAERYETNALVEINGNKNYIVQSDSVTEINENEHEHRIMLFENLARFDKVIPFERVFSKLSVQGEQVQLQTLGEVFAIYKEELEFYQGLEIDLFDDGTGYENTQIPLKEYSGGETFTNIMFDLFRRVRANPKVARDNGVWVFYPQYWETRGKNVSSKIENKEASLQQVSSGDYATEVKAFLKNVSNELVEEKWYPSSDGWIYPKSALRIAPESSLRYELDSAALVITKAIVRVKIREIGNSSNTEWIDVDIASRIVTRDAYDVLPTSSVINEFVGRNARNHLKYDIGSRFIEGLFESATDSILFWNLNTNYLRNAIRAQLGETDSRFGSPATWTLDGFTNEMIRTTGIRFKYVRERDMAVSTFKQHRGSMNKTTVLHAQRDSRVEANRFKDNLGLVINRLGNVEEVLSITHENDNDLVEIFDYSGSFVAVEVKNSYFGGFVMQEIKMSQNYANVNAENAISRRLDPFTIAQKRLTTNVIVDDFVQVSKQQKEVESFLNENGIAQYLKTFENDFANAEEVHSSVYQRLEDWNPASEPIHMPVMKTSGFNLSFHAQFDHPRIAGMMFENGSTEGEVLPYTDDKGVVEYFRWFLNREVQIQDDGTYPKINNLQSFTNNSYTVYFGRLPVQLDPLAAFAITYQINPITDSPNILIGKAFNELNYLLKADDIVFEVRWKNTPYTIFDKDLGELVSGGAFIFNAAERKMIFSGATVPYFALVANGQLMIAFNEMLGGGNINEYYINFIKGIDTIFFVEAETNNIYPLFSLGASESIMQLDQFADTDGISMLYSLGQAQSVKQLDQFANTNGIGMLYSLGSAASVFQMKQTAETDGIGMLYSLGSAASAAQIEQTAETDGIEKTFSLGQAASEKLFTVTWIPNGGTWGDNSTENKQTNHASSKQFTENDAPDTISRSGWYLTAWRVDGNPLPQTINSNESIEATWAQQTQLPTPVWQSLTSTQTTITAVVDNNNIDNEFDGVRTQIRFFGSNLTTDWITLATSNSRVVNQNITFSQNDYPEIQPGTSFTLQIRNISTVPQHSNSGTSTNGTTTAT